MSRELEHQLMRAQEEIFRLSAIVDNQINALHHWRRLSDQDAGTIAVLRAQLAKHGIEPSRDISRHKEAL